MRRLAGSLESIILFVIGLYMVLLALGDAYTLFLHPRYRWLTGSAGVALCILAVAGVRVSSRAVYPVRLLLFCAMVVVIAVFGQAPYISSSANQDMVEQYEDPSPTLERHGKTYTKINTGELYFLAREGSLQELDDDFAVRGIVARTPDLDALGYFALLRVNFVCCAADAMAMGVLVEYANVKTVESGQWVRVLGRPRALEKNAQLPPPPVMNKVFYSTVAKEFVMIADEVKSVYRPAKPYMFELSVEKPYNY
jgi:uncharacterized repeat protein (TIGR03943 family)